MKKMILDNLEMLNRINELNMASTFTKAGIVRHLQLEGSFNANMKTLDTMIKKDIVVVADGYYTINQTKIKQVMGSFK